MTYPTADSALAQQLSLEEHDKAHGAFLDYVYMGDERSLAKLASQYVERKKQGLPVPSGRITTLETWSRKFQWQARVQAFDAEQRRKRIAEGQKQIEQMHARQAQMGLAAQMKALERLRDPNFKLEKPTDVILFLVKGAQVERTARGVPIELIRLSNLSTDDLMQQRERVLAALRGDDAVIDMDTLDTGVSGLLEGPDEDELEGAETNE